MATSVAAPPDLAIDPAIVRSERCAAITSPASASAFFSVAAGMHPLSRLSSTNACRAAAISAGQSSVNETV